MLDDNAVSPSGRRAATPAAKAAAISLYLQVVAVVVILAFYLYETLQGATDNPMRAGMSMVTIAVLGGFVFVVARLLARGSIGARVPAIVWCVMLLPVGFDLVRGGQPLYGIPVLLSAVVVVVGCLLDMRARPGL